MTASRRCTATTQSGRPCRAWAMHDTDPPRCAIHAGRAVGGAPPGNRNAVTHGYYTAPDLSGETCARPEDVPRIDLNRIILDLAAKQAQLSAMIDHCLQDINGHDLRDIARLMALHAQTASRLGRLLRDQDALSGNTADQLQEAINFALDELSEEWGVEL